MFEVKNDPEKLTVYVRVSGLLRGDEAHAAFNAMRAAVDSYRGRSHLFLADMRGLLPLAPAEAAQMGESIAYSRRRGTILCVHLSDSAIVRLQASRLVREVSVQDTMTVDVVSLEEAELALDDARRHIASGGESGVIARVAAGHGRARVAGAS